VSFVGIAPSHVAAVASGLDVIASLAADAHEEARRGGALGGLDTASLGVDVAEDLTLAASELRRRAASAEEGSALVWARLAELRHGEPGWSVEVPAGAAVATFAIPRWRGEGRTRITFFIDDEEVCLVGGAPAALCGHGDGRDVVSGHDIAEADVPARVRIVLDHDAGVATVIASASRTIDGRDVAALPIGLDEGAHPSWVAPTLVDDRIELDYRFVNSLTPAALAFAAPAITGRVAIARTEDGGVAIDGELSQYPTVEIVRDDPTHATSALVFVRRQESGGPLNLYERRQPFAVGS
jgi:hypothetical protein